MIQLDIRLPDSFLIICPQCFDCWARLAGEDRTHWWHRYVPCQGHQADPYGAKLGGSLLDAEPSLLGSLPAILVERELSLYLQEPQ